MSILARLKWVVPFLVILVGQMASAADTTDTRKKLGETTWPSQTIGEVLREGQEPCTGTLIGYHLVLTAASCVFVYEETPLRGQIRPNLKGFRIREGYKPKTWINPILAVYAGTTFARADVKNPPRARIDTENNWAILILAEYTGHGALFPENINPPDYNFTFTGYGYEKPRAKPLPNELYNALYDECEVSRVNGNWPVMMKSQCRMSPAGIGGPDVVMLKRPGIEELDPVIVGMHILIQRPDGINRWGSPYQPYDVETSYVLSIKAAVFEDAARSLFTMDEKWPEVITDTAVLCASFPQDSCPLRFVTPPQPLPEQLSSTAP